MTAARRLAAILAADVVGYSRLMGEDEAGTAKAVREGHEASTPIVAWLGGQLVKTMGDGVMPGIFLGGLRRRMCDRLHQLAGAPRRGLSPDGDRSAAAPAATRSHAS